MKYLQNPKSAFGQSLKSVAPQKQVSRDNHALLVQNTPQNAAFHKNTEGSYHDFSRISVFAEKQTFIQPKLTINTPGDVYEQEADSMAERVMNLPDTSTASNLHISQKNDAIQRKGENRGGLEASSSLVSQLNTTKGGGSPLPEGTRSFMQNAFGNDFQGVRVHRDSRAREMSQGIQAKAFTHGQDIYFNQGQYSPSTNEGKRLLLHELTHTIQQGNRLSPQTIQREGEDKKKDTKEADVKTEVEVVTEHDFSKNETKVEGTTTRSSEQPVADGVTAKATEKITGEDTVRTAEVELKNEASGLSVTGGIEGTRPLDPTKKDTAQGSIKIAGEWTPFKLPFLNVESGTALEFTTDKKPKFSLDGKAVFFPNGSLSPEIAAGLVFNSEGLSGKVNAELKYKITDYLSAKAGAAINFGPDNKISVEGGAGLVLNFGK